MACLVVVGLAYVLSQTLNDNLTRDGGNNAVVREGSSAAVAEQAVNSVNAAKDELDARAKRLKCAAGGEGSADCPAQ